ncbi:(2Fe-2S)-binding protein [Kitasatospora sp. NPDC001175]|uniref:(2Fe-2S)-binding protein n=1 Tax=Kitasatospora sp. NPDC001175 TaxID=3157103 RepID=UPI003D038373
MPEEPSATEVFREVTAVGPYFAVEAAVGPGRPTGFRPLGELYDGGPEGFLAERIATVSARLGTAESRVAASISQLGLAARLWSVTLGAAVLTGTVPDLAPDRAYWHHPPHGMLELRLPAPVRTADLAGALRDGVVTGALAPLATAVRAATPTPVSERLLRGNAASALVGAVRQLAAHRPDAGRTAWSLAGELLGHAPLAGTGTLHQTSFRRSTCCLYYRLPNGGLCGDCVFRTPPARP